MTQKAARHCKTGLTITLKGYTMTSHHPYAARLISKCTTAATIALGLISFAGTAMAADKLAVRKDGAQVLSDVKPGSQIVVTLKKGEHLEPVERQGMFWQVTLSDGRKGFVRGLDVQRIQVEDSAAVTKALNEAKSANRQKEESNPRVRTSNAVMGIRGLDDTEGLSQASDVKPNLRHIYAMEDRRVASERVASIEQAVFTEIEERTK